MATTVISAPPPINDDFHHNHNHNHTTHNMARDDDDDEPSHPGENLLDKMVNDTSSPAPVTAPVSDGGGSSDNYTVERPRAAADSNSNMPHGLSNTTNIGASFPFKKVPRANPKKNKPNLAVSPPSQEDLHTRWAELQDPSSHIHTVGFKEENQPEIPQTPMTSSFTPTSFSEQQSVPRYVEPTPRAFTYETYIRDFAYPSHHILHKGPPFHDDDSDDEDVPQCDIPLSATAPAFIPGRSSDEPGPHRDYYLTSRRLSDSAESTMTGGRGLNGGVAQWTPGPWGGDGAMFEDMEPLPSTSFRSDGSASSEQQHDDTGIVWNSRQQSHRKSRSFADVPNYERGRRREGTGSSRGSWQLPRDNSRTGSRGGSRGGGYSDPAGRLALRASRGMSPPERTTEVESPAASPEMENDFYALSIRHPSSGLEERRDSHVTRVRRFSREELIAYQLARPNQSPNPPRRGGEFDEMADETLQNRAYHAADPNRQHRFSDVGDVREFPLDLEEPSAVLETSPKRDSIGPDDEELFMGKSLALYDFVPENVNELELREGQEVYVSYRHGMGWLVAENSKGEKGLIPEAYVRLLSDMENWNFNE